MLVQLGTTAAQLQTLINTAPAGTVLQLEAGHYRFDRTILIDRDDISVVGAGSGKTFIDLPSNLGEAAFQIGSGAKKGAFTLSADMAEGGTVMKLSGTHSFVAGDYVYLSRESTAAFYAEIGDTEWARTDVPLRTSIAKVVAVNGSQITLSPGVHFDFPVGETKVCEIGMAENVRVGGFTVDYGLATADPSRFANTLTAYDRNAVIEVDGTAGLKLFDVTSHDVPSLGVNVASSTRAQIDGITMTGAHNKGEGGNGYALQIRDVYDSSFTNLSDMDMRHSVVFASWTSAAGNFVHVSQTDRDINFHGGRDHDNVVMVDRSIRDANSDIISPTLFVNTEGTHYGTVTDASANKVGFGSVQGTRLADAITGYDNGALLDGKGGNDTLTGGAGNDKLIGGAGADSLNGMAGVDIAAYFGKQADFTIRSLGGGAFEVTDRVGTQSVDRLTGVEWLVFDDKAVDLRDMSVKPLSAVDGIFQGPGTWRPASTTTASQTTASASQTLATAGDDVFTVSSSKTVIAGLGGIDTVRSSATYTIASDVENLELTGTAAINGTGNLNANILTGNSAANTLRGMSGADQLRGGNGNDSLCGGSGNDVLHGDGGNDRLNGGHGLDQLFGGAGADVFIFQRASHSTRGASDRVMDFQTGVDKLDLSLIDADTSVSGNQAFVYGTSAAGAASLWVSGGFVFGDVNNDGIADLAIEVTGTIAQSDFLF